MSEDRVTPAGPSRFSLKSSRITGQPSQSEDSHSLAHLNVWNVVRDGKWLCFDGLLPETSYPRAYRKSVEGGPIMADTSLPLLGVFELGGQKAAFATRGPSKYPYHVFVADDDIGPVGMAGLEEAIQTKGLETLRERTIAGLVAEVILGWQESNCQAQPLFYVRTETDSSPDAASFAEGSAVDNLKRAVGNWIRAARHIKRPAELAAVIFDYASEDITSGPRTLHKDLLQCLDAIAQEVLPSGSMQTPKIVTTFDSGCQRGVRPAVIRAQWELALFHGAHDLTVAAPNYMFEHDALGWLSDRGRLHKAEMIAAALTYEPEPEGPSIGGKIYAGWMCPMPLLAEWEGDNLIRVTFRSEQPLIIDETDPFDVGPQAGFRLKDAQNNARISDVWVDENDPRAVLVRCENKPTGEAKLAYAAGAAPRRNRDYPTNAGNVRDEWEMTSLDGGLLHRWALPCLLDITGL